MCAVTLNTLSILVRRLALMKVGCHSVSSKIISSLTKIFNIDFSCFMTVSSIPYESQYSTASSAQFADFEGCNSDIEKDGWLNCSLIETCQSGPLVVKCEGMYI